MGYKEGKAGQEGKWGKKGKRGNKSKWGKRGKAKEEKLRYTEDEWCDSVLRFAEGLAEFCVPSGHDLRKARSPNLKSFSAIVSFISSPHKIPIPPHNFSQNAHVFYHTRSQLLLEMVE